MSRFRCRAAVPFVVEAMIGNFVPADGKLLILINGAYGKRIAKICDYYGRDYLVQESAEDVPVDTAQLDAHSMPMQTSAMW